ncbi:MAG: PEP-CTERM sorting domain-containing protein [Thiobacillus sp.]|nr:PEP-CTERM sorting domain-containing protein [Thiobacillus sp.]
MDQLKQTEISGITPVSEPETYAMLLAGLGLVGFAARRKLS